MGIRHKARECAVQILYEIDLTGQRIEEATDVFRNSFKIPDNAYNFCMELICGVRRNVEEIDVLIEKHSQNWRIDRMSLVDRNVLRLAVFELIYREDIPPKVTINEAVELGKRFGTEESGAFINGILDAVYSARKQNGPAE